MRIWTCGVLLGLLLMLPVADAMAQGEMWVQRVESQGRLLVPIRGIFEAFGAGVDWDASLRMVEIISGGNTIIMHVGDRNAFINGTHYLIDVPPRLVGGRVHVPLRFVSEAMGASVDYIGSYVDITAPNGYLVRVHLTGGSQSGASGGGGYIAPWTSSRRVTDGDLRGYSNWQLTLMRNEIYARHGRPFDNANVRAHFARQGWYRPRSGFSESWLSSLEQSNAAAIRNYQTRVYGAPATRP